MPPTSVVGRTYDARNRLAILSFPDTRGDQIWSYTPDGLPELIRTFNGIGHTLEVATAYHYNKRRLLDGQGESVSQVGWYSWGIGYGYDGYGHLAAQTYPTGQAVTYEPNALGQPRQVKSDGTILATATQYYPNGALQQFTYGNGIVHAMAQNARQLPQTSTDSGGVLSHQYGYDNNGNVTQVLDLNRGEGYSRWMGYDGLDRLISAGSCSFGPGCWFNYSYDALDNLTRVQGPSSSDRYYCYDTRWQLTNIKTGSCNGATVTGLDYDVRGNLSKKNSQAYDFDFGNRLRAVPGQETYRYDGLGRRVFSTRPDQSQHFFQYSQAGQLMFGSVIAANQTQTTQQYVYLAGSLIATIDRTWPSQTVNSVRYQHTDALGTPVAETDTAGNVVQRSEYDPYGRLNNRPLTDAPGYTGHYQDAATGLTYMQQRYYDPQVGRFLSMDPVTADVKTGGNFNRYWYANNNPYRFTDPDGRFGRDFDSISKEAGTYLKTPPPSDKDWLGPAIGYSLMGIGAIAAAPVVAGAGTAVYTSPSTIAIGTDIAAGAAGVTGTAGAAGLTAREVKALVSAANKPYNSTGLSVAARKLEQHAMRPGGTFAAPTGTVAQKNEAASNVVQGILSNPETVRTGLSRGGTEFRLPNGQGVRFDADDVFNTFLDPKR